MARRVLRGMAAAALLIALTAGAASAGGWATIQTDASNPTHPNAGEPFTFGFTVLQHGVTPAGWVETPTYLGINGATGERIEVKAVAKGADGHFVATVTLPSAGFWTWQVVLTDLIVETAPQPVAVAMADGSLPAMDTGSMLAAIERVRTEIRTEYQAQLFTETDAMRAQITALDAKVRYLDGQRASAREAGRRPDRQRRAAAATPAGDSVAALRGRRDRRARRCNQWLRDDGARAEHTTNRPSVATGQRRSWLRQALSRRADALPRPRVVASRVPATGPSIHPGPAATRERRPAPLRRSPPA